MEQLAGAYRTAQRRLLLLDYDGTLMELKPTPPEAAPTADTVALLSMLTADAANTTVLVSGRPQATMAAWFGDIPGLSFCAEHGFWRKPADGQWHATLPQDVAWQARPRAIMDAATAKVAGTYVETKNSGLAWHYRTAANPVLAQQIAEQLRLELAALTGGPAFRAMPGAQIVEIQLAGADKGTAVAHWLSQAAWDFVLVVGDDVTDEDMFRAVPAQAFTIKIGSGDTAARLRLPDPAAARDLLRQLGRS